MRRVLLPLLLLLTGSLLHAQQTVSLEGTVVDAESGAPISGAVVHVTDAGKRTYTSQTGRFRIPVTTGVHTVRASSIGYKDSTFTFSTTASPVTIALRPSSVLLEGVEVTAGLSADQIIQRAIAKKEENVRKAKTVQGLLYSKTQFEITGNAFGQINDEDRMAIFETFSRAYYSDRGPRIEVIQRRQTANIPANQNLLALGNFISFYDDELPLLNTTIPSPLNPNTLSRYNFSLRERSSIGGQTVYIIDVTPATRLLPTFEGTIKIIADSYNLVEVDLRPSGATAIAFVSDLRCQQKFEKFQDDIWQPTYLHITGRGNVEIVRGLAQIQADVSATSIFTELQVNAPIPDSVYANERIIAAAPDADSSRPEFWEKNALSELTDQEKDIYKKVDSLVTEADTTSPERGVRFEAEPHLDFNRVGSVTVGLDITPRFGPVRLDGFGAYSFGLRRWVGRAGGTVELLGGEESLTVGGHAFSLLEKTSGDRPYPELINTATAALFHRDYYDYYRKDGWNADARFDLGPVAVGAGIEMARHSSRSNSTSRSIFLHKPFRSNPAVLDGNFRTIQGNIQWGRAEEAISISSSQSGGVGARVAGTYGEEPNLGLSFRSAEGNLRLTIPTIPTGYTPMLLHLALYGGIGSDNLPTQYQFRMRTSVAFLGRLGAFYSAPTGLYGGTRYAAAAAEHNFGDILWRAVGLPTYYGRGLELSVNGATGYFENENATGYSSTGNQWYSEVGFGVGKIPTFISNVIYLNFDARWGIGPLGSGKFGMVVGLSSPF